jgi:hypothetical protein
MGTGDRSLPTRSWRRKGPPGSAARPPSRWISTLLSEMQRRWASAGRLGRSGGWGHSRRLPSSSAGLLRRASWRHRRDGSRRGLGTSGRAGCRGSTRGEATSVESRRGWAPSPEEPPGAAAPFLHSSYIIRREGAGRHSRRRQFLEFLRMCRRLRSPSRAGLPRRRACPARPARMGRADHNSSTAALQLGAIPGEGPSNWAPRALAPHHERYSPRTCNACGITLN